MNKSGEDFDTDTFDDVIVLIVSLSPTADPDTESGREFPLLVNMEGLLLNIDGGLLLRELISLREDETFVDSSCDEGAEDKALDIIILSCFPRPVMTRPAS